MRGEGEDVQMCKCANVNKWEMRGVASLRGRWKGIKFLTQGREVAERWLGKLYEESQVPMYFGTCDS